MSRANTRLPGHGLIGEGLPIWRRGGCAVCICGAKSPPNISQNAARRWMREHKNEIRRVVTVPGPWERRSVQMTVEWLVDENRRLHVRLDQLRRELDEERSRR